MAAARGFPCRATIFTFRGRVSTLVFAAAAWKSRTPLLPVAVAALQRGQLYDFASLRGHSPRLNSRSTAPFRVVRPRKTPDRRCNSWRHTTRGQAGAACEKWPETCLAS
ncbi:hypothetical protein ALC62_02687 [Cyphomyrmex costatus]|uniref:Uncharacterized protein n=1 Tax=Cyphomyrmex costatus TaxID=456900 RepID=A0A195D0A5_9HYME|nr:hypothetical protein ALC62_02687 [Cyphomyrmex costatus]